MVQRVRVWAATALTAAIAAPVALAATPAASPPLTGETLTGTGPATSMHCEVREGRTAGSFDYEVTGLATGPYTGMFVESGSVAFDVLGGVESFHATFDIVSAAGNVHGTKNLASPSTLGNGARCASLGLNGRLSVAGLQATYTATIQTSTGTRTEHGTSTVTLFALPTTPSSTTGTATLTETFEGPTLPTSRDACKDEGFASFPVFKNQGQCVRFVETGKLDEETTP